MESFLYNLIYLVIWIYIKVIRLKKIIHYPNLKTVLMVEDVLKEANTLLTREQLKKSLPTKIMHQTLNVILNYLEDSGKIIDGRKGIVWIQNKSSKMDNAIEEGVEM